MRKHMKSSLLALLMVGVIISMTVFAAPVFAEETADLGAALELEAVISLTDHPDDFSEDYTVALTAADEETPMPVGCNGDTWYGTRTGAGSIAVDPINFGRPGIYEYSMEQIAGSADRWTYDDAVYEIVVYVTNNAEGGLDVNAAIRKEGEEEKSELVFVNVYEPLPVSVGITAKKTMDGKVPENGAFEFVLEDWDGNVLETVSNTDGGVISFSDVEFKEAGVYELTVYEVEGTNKRITYDTSKYAVIVTVTQDGDLVADISYEKNGRDYSGDIIFANMTGPKMGDDTNIGLWIGLCAASAVVIILLFVLGKKKDK